MAKKICVIKTSLRLNSNSDLLFKVQKKVVMM